jgi:hypothetical protein
MKAVNHFEQGYIDTAEPLGVRGPRSIGIAIYDPQQTCSIAAALNKAWELFWDGPHAFVGLNTRLVPSRDSKPAAMIPR